MPSNVLLYRARDIKCVPSAALHLFSPSRSFPFRQRYENAFAQRVGNDFLPLLNTLISFRFRLFSFLCSLDFAAAAFPRLAYKFAPRPIVGGGRERAAPSAIADIEKAIFHRHRCVEISERNSFCGIFPFRISIPARPGFSGAIPALARPLARPHLLPMPLLSPARAANRCTEQLRSRV